MAAPRTPVKSETGDLTSPRLIIVKGLLFLVIGVAAAAALLLEVPRWKLAALLILAIWGFCRFYYFAFYVIQHYVDDGYRFSGLGSFVRYLLNRREPADTARPLATVAGERPHEPARPASADRPLFAGIELAAHVERAECDLLQAATDAIRARRGPEAAWTRPIAGGLASLAGPSSPLTKVAGLGFAGRPDPAEWEAIERHFAQHGAGVQVEISSLADPAVAAELTARGYRLAGYENVLGRRPAAAGTDSSDPVASAAAFDGDLQVRECEPDEHELWLNVVLDGFLRPDGQGVASHESFEREVLARIIGDMAAVPGMRRYLAWRAGEAAGGASMRVAHGVAQFCGAATLPAHRRRGVQAALLAARLQAAAQHGCDLAIVTTLPGSKSQQNVERYGFQLLYARAMLVREFERRGE